MQYRNNNKTGKDVSLLGFGSMRLPTRQEGEKTVIHREEAIALIRHAIDSGVNYMDTAYAYHNMESEVVMGLALKDGYREKVTLTSKLPPWYVSEKKDLDRILDEQLNKMQVPYLDYYILHSLNKENFEKLCALDFRGFYDRALKDGRIKHTGFSFHDEFDVYMDILTSYDFDMTQVQFNYLDEFKQATLQGVIEAGKRHVPVVIMEPLRGGALATPPKNVQAMMDGYEKQYSPVEWAFRYVADRPEVLTILSGMSNRAQLDDNIRIFSQEDFKANNLTQKDLAFTKDLREAYYKRMPIPCTHCDYCQPCPMDVKIPDLFASYNEAHMFDREQAFKNAYKDFESKNQDASKCVACKKCMSVCPQHIDIVSWLQKLHQDAK